jgi:LacI family transcriptional regulator
MIQAKGRPTVTDVAKVAHVGASTVSRYLRGVSIRPDAAVRVAAAIEQLSYTPDEAARALRGASTRTIGIIVPQVDNTFFSKAIQEIEKEARRRGFTVLLLLHEEDKNRQTQHLATLRRYRADGVVMSCAVGSNPEEVTAALAGTPIVAFDRPLDKNVDSVVLRNREAARTATDHLLRHGYKDIACITARTAIFSFRERIAGYTEAMQAAGRKPHLLEATDYNDLRMILAPVLSSRRSPHALLSLSNMATGSILFAFNDMALNETNRLPVIGFDDFDFAPLMNPSLSVIRQPVKLMVRYALDLLFRRIESVANPLAASESAPEIQNITLAGELVCRRSCGCD